MSVEQFLEHCAQVRSVAASTLAAYRFELRQLRAPGLVDVSLASREDVRCALESAMRRHVGLAALRRRLSVWRGYFAWLQAHRRRTDNPCDGVPLPGDVVRFRPPLTREQLGHLAGQTPGDAPSPERLRTNALWYCALTLGLSPRELVGLTLAHWACDRDGDERTPGRLVVRGAWAPVSADTANAIKRWLQDGRPRSCHAAESPWLFVSRKGPQLTENAASRAMAAHARANLGAPNHRGVTLQAARASLARNLLRENTPRQTREHLGLAASTSLSRYR